MNQPYVVARPKFWCRITTVPLVNLGGLLTMVIYHLLTEMILHRWWAQAAGRSSWCCYRRLLNLLPKGAPTNGLIKATGDITLLIGVITFITPFINGRGQFRPICTVSKKAAPLKKIVVFLYLPSVKRIFGNPNCSPPNHTQSFQLWCPEKSFKFHPPGSKWALDIQL